MRVGRLFGADVVLNLKTLFLMALVLWACGSSIEIAGNAHTVALGRLTILLIAIGLWWLVRLRMQMVPRSVIVGRLLASGIMLCGVLQTLVEGFGVGLCLTFIGWFLLQEGEGARTLSRLIERLQGHTAGELAIASPAVVRAQQHAEAALQVLLDHRLEAAPVYVGERFLGMITLQQLVRVPDPEQTYVTAVMTRADECATIASDAGPEAIAAVLAEREPLVPVLGADGEVVGFLTRERLLTYSVPDAEAIAPTSSGVPRAPAPE